MPLTIHSTITLTGGVPMPRFGLGMFALGSDQGVIDAVAWALDAGYRLFDTAQMYRNERALGTALREADLPREEVFITTKLNNGNHGRSNTRRSFDQSLRDLGVDFVDLFLIHWPVSELRHESWDVLVEFWQEGRARAIGVSNYLVRHLEELKARSDVLPAVNQIEMSPYIYQHRHDTVAWCAAHGVVVEAYSPLTKGQRLHDPRLVEIADRYGKTSAQVLIRWALQKDFVVIPKSGNPGRILKNAEVFDFELAPDDLARLDSFDERLKTSWDPTDAP